MRRTHKILSIVQAILNIIFLIARSEYITIGINLLC